MIAAALWASIATPFAIAALLVVRPPRHERAIAGLALMSALLSSAASLLAIACWLGRGALPIRTAPYTAFERGGYSFTLALQIDGAAAVFLMLVQFITGLVVRFSRFYLHREAGFRRFFTTVLLFQGAMCVLALGGNIDLVLAGWELLGLSSFLLIAFYRERQSAARNALKTYSVYRMADIGLLLAACLQGSGAHHTIGLLLLLAAMGKSAQFPFSFWVARAMEGPTPSSALFYGALSVHAGAYLLLRTFPLFAGAYAVRACIGTVGVVTAVSCSMFSRVQPTIKGQIGYASVCQVGIIFVEIALGLSRLALLHIVCNALLRCYQLLVSPSVVAHRLRQQASAGAARAAPSRSLYARIIPAHWWPTLYAFALSEGYLKDILKAGMWFPMRRLGASLERRRGLLIALAASGAIAALLGSRRLTSTDELALAAALVVLAVAFAACGLDRWRRPGDAVLWICGSNLLAAAAALAWPREHAGRAALLYGVGLVASAALSVGALAAAGLGGIAARFSGRWEARPTAAVFAFLGAVGIAGVPLWPTFWGEDLVVHAALGESRWLALVIAAILAANGYLAMRNFAYAFMGLRRHAESSPAQAHREA